jgi:SHS family lactate transporter-like MFS transporter
VAAIVETTAKHWKLFAYLVVLMTLFMFLSHGTQDLYPDFLKHEHGVTPNKAADIAILYNLGAVLGAILFGHLSEKIGRRYSILAALSLSLAMIPAWAFGQTMVILALGAFAMQMGVQGAWGIVPAHLNEVSPDAVRGLVPGLAYQLGILFASPTSNIEHKLRDLFGYSWALAAFEVTVIVALGFVTWVGKENKGKVFAAENQGPSLATSPMI